MTKNTELKKNRMATASLVLAIIAIAFDLLPLISGFLALLTPFAYILELLAIIFGIVALVQKAPITKPILGIVLALIACILPLLLAEYMLDSTFDFLSGFSELL